MTILKVLAVVFYTAQNSTIGQATFNWGGGGGGGIMRAWCGFYVDLYFANEFVGDFFCLCRS